MHHVDDPLGAALLLRHIFYIHSYKMSKIGPKKILLVSCGKTSLEIHVFVVARE